MTPTFRGKGAGGHILGIIHMHCYLFLIKHTAHYKHTMSICHMGFKIVSRYQRIKCVYFKTLNDALIFWITTKLTLKTQR